jgi:hypothetical protein
MKAKSHEIKIAVKAVIMDVPKDSSSNFRYFRAKKAIIALC